MGVLRGSVQVAVAAMLLATGCTFDSGGSPTPSQAPSGGMDTDAAPAAIDLAEALNEFDLAGLDLTTDATAAQDELETIFSGMDGYRPSITLGEISYEASDIASVTLHHTYEFSVARWKFDSQAKLLFTDAAWHVVWSPSMMHPKLTATTRLRHVRTEPRRAAINDNEGLALVEQLTRYQVGLDKAAVTPQEWDTAAGDLAHLLGIDAAAFQAKVAAGGDRQFVVAQVLSEMEITPDVGEVPGATILPIETMVSASDTFAISLLGTSGLPSSEVIEASDGAIEADDIVGLSGLQQRYDQRLRGTPGVSVDLMPRDSTGAEGTNLFLAEPVTGTALDLSLDRDLQTRAEDILAGQPGLASIVVIDPATGGILVAANSPAAGVYPHATYGQYAPGSTFKVVSALALLRSGLSPDSTISCPPTLKVASHTFGNYSGYPSSMTGNISLQQALAYSCNTAFAGNAGRTPPDKLHAAAGSLGVGTDYDAGFTSFFGTVAPNSSSIDQAASMIGQGQITMSPMAMAAVAASVASGTTTIPWLVKGEQATSTAAPLTQTEAAQLRQMMTATVSHGSATSLKGTMTGAKTGTAEFGSSGNYQTHAWMIAWRSDVAVAAFVEVGESGSSTAGPLITKLFES
ncbi:MAG: penicillin-binding transpeptidase domain-containing protein [Arachnia sp.]